MKVYVIQTDLGLGYELENRYATLDKEVAKKLIKDEIVDCLCDETIEKQRVEAFAQDLVDENSDNHYCDEFEGIRIWCDIMILREK